MCMWSDLHTCAAQGCDGLVRDPFDGHPFCDACFELLPEKARASLIPAWREPTMCMISEPATRQFVGPISKKLITVIGSGTKQRQVIDVDGWIESRRRLEISAAWTIRRIKLRGQLPSRTEVIE